ncbi:hypothetical protein F5879DRAFT_984199 [Lentinula edodes]|nr:hypothetical protein F5879DRAFT_984199 [Lentinula edodes]
MPNKTQTRTILNDKQFQILTAAFDKAFYQTDEAVAQLVNDTGLTSAQNWFSHRRRVLREKEFERRRIAAKEHQEDNKQDLTYMNSYQADSERLSKTASESLRSSNASSQYSINKPSLPPISSMFPEIFNSEYDYTLPPDVHPIKLPDTY